MTVSTETASVSYAGNGATTVFSVPYYFLENSHIRVVLRTSAGVESTKILTTDYTVSGAGTNPSTATITCVSFTPASGQTLRIVRDPPLTQDTDYVENDPFPAETHEEALDKLTMIAQAISTDLGRALRLPETSSASSLLPDPASNGGLFLGLNQSATAFTYSASGSGSLTNVDYKFASVAAMSSQTGMANNAIALTFGYYTAGDGGHGEYRYDSSSSATVNGGTVINAAGGAGRWLLQYSGSVNIKQFGTKADWNCVIGGGATGTDNATAIQAAIDFSSTQLATIIASKVNTVKSCVIVPCGHYLFSSITIPESVSLVGESKGASVLYSSVSGTAKAIYMGSNSRECSSVIVERITLIGSGTASGTSGVYFENCLRGCFVRDCNVSGFGYNLYGQNTYGMHIADNFIHDAVTNNIFWYGATADVIERNRLDDCPNGDNIVFDGQSSSEAHGIIVSGNAIQRAKYSGVKGIDIDDITFIGNFFEGNDIAGGNASAVSLIQGSRVVKTRRAGFYDNYTGLGSVTGAGHVCINIVSAYRVVVLGHKLKNGVGSHGNAIVLGSAVDHFFGRANDLFAASTEISSGTPTIIDNTDLNKKSRFGLGGAPAANYDWADSVSAGNLANFNNQSATSGSVTLQLKAGDTGTNTFQIYGLDSAGTNTFRVTGNGDTRNLNNVFAAISDERLKDVIGLAPSSWDDFKQIEFVKYKLKGDDLIQLGVIAQQVKNISPGLVSLSPIYEENEEGEKVSVGDFYDVKYSILNLKACVVLQEAMKRIEALENRANNGAQNEE